MHKEKSSCTHGLKVTVLTALASGSIALFVSLPAHAFVLSVGPSNSTFGDTVCADVAGGSLNSGTKVQAWAC